MIKKIYIQFFLLSLILLSLVWFYNKYFNNEKNELSKTEYSQENNIDDTKSNLIYNLNYQSTDLENNTYLISSESGEMSQNGTDFLMNSVYARITLNDKSEIIITADNALYNNNNYNTKFFGNVVSKYGINSIFSQKMDLNFDVNKIKIFEKDFI